jgi:DnaJ-class molecular chaperone
MKKLIPGILLVLTFLTGCEPEVKRVEGTPEKQSQQSAPKIPGGPEHIICVECKGERFIMVRSESRSSDIRQSCPICSGNGFRDLRVPADKQKCPDCKGMGALIDKKGATNSLGAGAVVSGKRSGEPLLSSGFATKLTCTRCTGTGLVFKAK